MPDNDTRFPVLRTIDTSNEAADEPGPLSTDPRPASRNEQRITLVSFPGGMQQLTFPPGPVTLRMVLTRAGVRPEDFGNAEVSIDNTVTTDFGLHIKDGTVIARTVRVEGGTR